MIVVERGRIVAVGGRNDVAVPAAAQRIDCAGAVIVAGFQNSHVHFTEDHWTDAARQPDSVTSTDCGRANDAW